MIDYGEYSKKLCSKTISPRLIALRDGVPVGIVQGICTAWGLSKYHRIGTVMTVREGPVLSLESTDKLGLLKLMMPAFENLGVKNHIMKIEIIWPCKWGYANLFENMGYKNVGTNTTYAIDLSKGSEDLWKHIYGNKRRNIKKALDRGVEFVESSNFKDIEEFHGLVLEVARRDRFVPAPLSWFQTIWKSRSQKDSSKLFFARWKGENVSGVFVTIHSKTIYALSFGYLTRALDVRPNDLLHWKIMEWGCNRGLLRYHMGEMDPEEGLYAGTWRWKREWNGDLDYAYIFRKSISKYGLVERVHDRLQSFATTASVQGQRL
jgi:lipid II:glycine glycyltransferase (peptidoglycan interpeptide bridge formation enzyme)